MTGFFFFGFFFKYNWVSEPHLARPKVYFWLWMEQLLLAVLEERYGMPRFEPGMATCKASILPSILPLRPVTVFIISSLFLHYIFLQSWATPKYCHLDFKNVTFLSAWNNILYINKTATMLTPVPQYFLMFIKSQSMI